MVLDIDEDRRRISLGIKQCKGNPWEEFAALHGKGDKIKDISSQSLTSVSLLGSTETSMVSFTCLTFPGMSRGSKRLETSPKAMRLKPLYSP